ncbi:MAG: response regulator [Lentisphaerae bacterium]|nr:response regulator [Lentisphaerota bacterium]
MKNYMRFGVALKGVKDVAKYKVLVIDDEYSLLRLVQMLLMRKGYEVSVALSSQDGKNHLLKDGATDAIVLDLMMPKESGFAFLEWKDLQSEEIKKIPVIVDTAKNLKDEELSFLKPRIAQIVLKEMNFTENLTAQIDALFKDKPTPTL